MNTERLYRILGETTIQIRKGEIVNKHEPKDGIAVTEIYMLPAEDEVRPNLERVDMEFVTIGVDKAKAETHKAELIEILKHYPRPDELAGGPSYIAVGGVIGDQGAAFQLFALGKVLGLWDVITPASMGFEGPEARDLAGRGFIMMTGYQVAA
jgi:hypothetical protein